MGLYPRVGKGNNPRETELSVNIHVRMCAFVDLQIHVCECVFWVTGDRADTFIYAFLVHYPKRHCLDSRHAPFALEGAHR